MQHSITCAWQEDLSFESTVNGHKITLDADTQFGGKDRGPRPKPLLLTALAGCAGMDIVSILQKSKQNITYFNTVVTGNVEEETPHPYTEIVVKYQFKRADNLDHKKVEKAVQLSEEKYCGVRDMLIKAVSIKSEIEYV